MNVGEPYAIRTCMSNNPFENSTTGEDKPPRFPGHYTEIRLPKTTPLGYRTIRFYDTTGIFSDEWLAHLEKICNILENPDHEEYGPHMALFDWLICQSITCKTADQFGKERNRILITPQQQMEILVELIEDDQILRNESARNQLLCIMAKLTSPPSFKFRFPSVVMDFFAVLATSLSAHASMQKFYNGLPAPNTTIANNAYIVNETYFDHIAEMNKYNMYGNHQIIPLPRLFNDLLYKINPILYTGEWEGLTDDGSQPYIGFKDFH